jgi:glycerophosphoryl diester phosphodiesterase
MNGTQEKMNRFKLRLHYLLAFILLLQSLFFIVYWLSVGSFRPDVNQFVSEIIGLQLPYTTIVIILYTLIAGWSLVRFIGLRFTVKSGVWKPFAVNWVYAGVCVVFTVGIYLSFWIILKQNPSQKGVLLHLLNLVRLVSDAVIFLFIAIWLRRSILFFRKRMAASEGRKWQWGVGIVAILVTLVGLWLVPALFPPNWAYQGDLPTRPALMAHRGASMLAPENTLAAGELAAENQALGFETDVRISLDGVPFLMHDETLARTTNIAEVFPDRENDDASSFTIDELKQLNAGLWFIQTDPFGTISKGLVSQAQLSIDQGQRIPTLSEALDMVKTKGMVIMFDMRYPPADHPYYDEFFDVVLKVCLESGLNGDVWFLVDEENLSQVMSEAPQMTRVTGTSSEFLPSPDSLLNLHYEIVNVDTGITAREIQAYRDQGLGVNVYTIDEPWLFSQFWLSGITSVTTNNIQTFSQLEKPYLNVPYSRYLLFWGLYGIIIAIWLASSQPERMRSERQQMETPDLMDFVRDGDETVDTTHMPKFTEPEVNRDVGIGEKKDTTDKQEIGQSDSKENDITPDHLED